MVKMDKEQIMKYYADPTIQKEILDYSRGRWIALEGKQKGDQRIFVRYWKRGGKPLTIEKLEDIEKLLKRFISLSPRSIYATLNVYRNLNENLEAPSNIKVTTPVWDIDCDLDKYEYSLEAAKIILSKLQSYGVTESVYLKWSGRGVHIHLNENSISNKTFQKYNPLDIAYSIVELINRQAREEINKISMKTKGAKRVLKVENDVDLKRVFTVPLSLHRLLDYACVCFKPEELDNFSLEWANPEKPKHNTKWRDYREREADKLALTAIKEIGGYIGWKPATSSPKVETQKKYPAKGKIGRFQVMSIIQAARYYVLTGDLEKAKSFGLNRAIFYAWAKYHGRERIPKRRRGTMKPGEEIKVESIEGKKLIYIGNEGAYISERGWFIINGIRRRKRKIKCLNQNLKPKI